MLFYLTANTDAPRQKVSDGFGIRRSYLILISILISVLHLPHVPYQRLKIYRCSHLPLLSAALLLPSALPFRISPRSLILLAAVPRRVINTSWHLLTLHVHTLRAVQISPTPLTLTLRLALAPCHSCSQNYGTKYKIQTTQYRICNSTEHTQPIHPCLCWHPQVPGAYHHVDISHSILCNAVDRLCEDEDRVSRRGSSGCAVYLENNHGECLLFDDLCHYCS